jgi:hypothetical protein
MDLRAFWKVAIVALLPFAAPAWVFAEEEGGTPP